MSGFLLCWHRGGDPIAPDVIRHAAAHRAPGSDAAPRSLVRGDVGAWHWPGEWAPGAEESLPLERSGWIGSGTLRLDDRVSLAARLRDKGFVAHGSADALLAWDSFAVWGEGAPRRWIGDYALAVVRETRERMVVARGVTGVRACFHASLGALECVSDDLGLLVRLAGGRGEPPPEAVAEYLRHGQLVSPRLTFHRRITRVPTAHTLIVERDGRQRLERHWTFPAPAIVHDRSDDEVFEEFRCVVRAAVRDRLRGPSAALLLSGGLDSSALAVEASALVDVRVRAFTASWERLIEDDEGTFARAVAAATGLEHEVVAYAPAEGISFSVDEASAAAYAFITPEPEPDVEARVWRAQAARLARKAPVVLNGEDVDALLMPPPLLAQLRREGVGATVGAWRAYHRATGRRPWIGLRRSIPGVEAWRERRGAAAPKWLLAASARLGAGTRLRSGTATRRSLGAPSGADEFAQHPRAQSIRALTRPMWDATCWLDDPGMSGADLVVLLPFMDPRVIEFCFALPPVPWLQRKHLMRSAYHERLPQAVVERGKTPLQGYYGARVRSWRMAGADAPLPVAVDEWVDMKRWRAALARTDDADAVFAAWRVLELSRWLAQPEAP
jgi:asparagine synthase (glutamine-hydrolysing)